MYAASFRGLKPAVRGRAGGRRNQHRYGLQSKNPHLVVFSPIKLFGHNDETTQRGAHVSVTQLQYKTVGKRH